VSSCVSTMGLVMGGSARGRVGTAPAELVFSSNCEFLATGQPDAGGERMKVEG
jgi:hypothetical protein